MIRIQVVSLYDLSAMFSHLSLVCVDGEKTEDWFSQLCFDTFGVLRKV